MPIILIATSVSMAAEKKHNLLENSRKGGNQVKSRGLLIDSLMAEHLRKHLCVYFTKQNYTTFSLNGKGTNALQRICYRPNCFTLVQDLL